jgi:hypothetical protein
MAATVKDNWKLFAPMLVAACALGHATLQHIGVTSASVGYTRDEAA